MTKANKITTIAIAILLLLIILFLCSCNFQNVEYRRWDTQGNLIENVRMGKVNVLYWFALNDLGVDSQPLKVNVGRLTEYPDPNSVEALTESLKLINRIPL